MDKCQGSYELCRNLELINRLAQENDELEELLAALLNKMDLPFQNKDESIPDYQKRLGL
jgi:hypothetical protein